MSLDELKELSPKERLKRLKELQEEDKKEIEEAEELIKQSVHDVEQEEIDEVVRRIKKPELRKVNVEDLFDDKKEDVKRDEKKEESLEDKAETAPKPTQEEINSRIGNYSLAREETYDKVRGLVEKAQQGTITQQEQENLSFYKKQFDDVNPDYMQGNDRDVVERTEQLLDKIMKYY
ncbi:hypothetical protein HN592_04165 [Candidatus Woesearchaeota archaeon]|jgi:hypothetical protein|nr:hypothetical protein [Candidatus Woesearchaeota archaeon]MBT4368407.1 hypothetical protein [Candidatus Woesearchaeota archaeon]MBT4712896.1 hypothetical protein [Candidatus Woesearchaeota archaeon]MBT6639808.1 hypothetical protein [Candidatus Woesearchaeota archaeon]MBT7133980.1 hypothetical protein [Candidatus Woesearchaeota archaeon]